MNIPYVFKKCTKCGEILPATKEYFRKKKGGKYGLEAQCKKCRKKYYQANKETFAEQKRQYYQANKETFAERQRQYYQTNKEAIAERNRQYYQENKEVINERRKEYNRQYYERNKEHIAEYYRQYNETHKEAIAEYRRQWKEQNKEAIAERNRQYREQNKEAIAERGKKYRKANKEAIAKRMRQYRQENKEAIAEYSRKYHQSPQGQVVAFNSQCRRRVKLEAQGRGITKEQWLECMSFFNWQCAYSGEYLGGKGKGIRTIDHIVPLNKGGANEIWNVVPAYKNYNFSKQDKDLLEWYTEQPYFSQERLDKIYEWQEYAFNKWGTIDNKAQ